MGTILTSVRLHPLLLAIYPVLHLYAKNVADVYFPWTILGLASAAAISLILIFLLLIRDGGKASLLASLCIVWLIFGISISDLLSGMLALIGLHDISSRTLLTIVSILTVGLGAWLITTRTKLLALNQMLTVGSAVMIALAGYSTVAALVTDYRMAALVPAEINPLDTSQFNLPEDPAALPNIIYIVADGRASTSVLKSLYGYSDEKMNQELADMGFTVAGESMANYGTTVMALAASLNMDYVEFPKSITNPSQKYGFMMKQIENNRVSKALQQIGYQYIQVASGFKATNNSATADITIKPEDAGLADEFVTAILINLTVCEFFCTELNNQVASNREWLGNPDWYRRRIRFSLQQLDEIELTDDPTFVFLHVVAPHGPYVLDSDGNEVIPATSEQRASGAGRNLKHDYIEQLQYIDKRLAAGIKSLLSRTGRPTAVILQSDHGPQHSWSKGLAATDERLMRERMFVLNAFLLPGKGSKPPYDVITPVNNFRHIFNVYFDANLETLPDKSFLSYFPGESNMKKFNYVEITDVLQNTNWESLKEIDGTKDTVTQTDDN
jgi:hypothetical protein